MPSSMMSLYGLGLGADTTSDDETAKALAAAAAATSSAHSAFPYNMYNPLLAYNSMLAQGLGMNPSQNYAQALSSAGNTSSSYYQLLLLAFATSFYY